MRPHADDFVKAGGKLVVVGNGWPAMAKSWAEHVGFPPSVAVVTDPSRKAYDENIQINREFTERMERDKKTALDRQSRGERDSSIGHIRKYMQIIALYLLSEAQLF